jgi:phosphatidylinositol dimannoside acyltransferase
VPGRRGRATYAVYRGAAGLAQALPPSVVTRLTHVAGRAARYPQPAHHRMARRHQRRVTPDASDAELTRAVQGMWDSYARYWMEIFRMPAEVRDGNVVDHFTIDGYEHIERGLAAGNGVILALPHLGGWEWAAAWMAAPPRSHHMLAVVEALEPPELLDWFERQRAAMGLEVAPLGPDVARRVLGALRDGRIVCLLADRDLTGDGVDADFFGERTTLPAGPATVALRTGATLLPAAVYFQAGRDHHAVVRPPVPVERTGRLRNDVARITQELAKEFEALIRAAPEQWHLFQPNWPSDRNGRTGA